MLRLLRLLHAYEEHDCLPSLDVRPCICLVTGDTACLGRPALPALLHMASAMHVGGILALRKGCRYHKLSSVVRRVACSVQDKCPAKETDGQQ